MKSLSFMNRTVMLSIFAGLVAWSPVGATEGAASPKDKVEESPDAGAPPESSPAVSSTQSPTPQAVETSSTAPPIAPVSPQSRPVRSTTKAKKKRVRKLRRAKKRAKSKRKKARRSKRSKRQRWPIKRPKVKRLGIPKLGPAPYEAGERLLFQVKMFGTVAGEAILAVGQRTRYKGRNALPLVGFIRSGEFLNKFYPVNDRMVVLVDEESLLPLKTDFYVKENTKVIDYHNTYDQRGRLITSKRKKAGKTLNRNFTLAAPIYEPLGSVYGARRLDLKVGDTFSYYAWDGRKERLISIKVVAEERMWTEAGWFDTHKMVVDSQITGGFIRKSMLERPVRRATVWIGQDRYRTPVKMISPTKLGDAEVLFVRRSQDESNLDMQ